MERVTQRELVFLMIMFLFGSPVGFFIGPLAAQAAYSGWQSVLLGVLGGLGITYIAFRLARKQPERFLIDYGRELVGRWPHAVLMAIVLVYFLYICASTVRQTQDFLVQTYLPTTPEWAVSSLFGLCVILAVRSGIEAVFRIAGGFFFIVFGAIVFTPIFVGKELEWSMAVALIRHWELQAIWNGAFHTLPRFGELSFVMFLYPCLKNREKTFSSLSFAGASAAFLFVLNYYLCVLLFGPHLTAHFTYPALEMVRYIRMGDFLENLDPLLVAIWMTTLFLKCSLLLLLAVNGLGQLLGLKNSRPLVFSIGAMMIALSQHTAKDHTEIQYFYQYAWPTLALLVQFIPLLYLVVSWIRGLSGQSAKPSNS